MRKHILLSFLCSIASALFARQEITVQNISLQSVEYRNVSCLAVQCDILLSQTYNERIRSGDSAEVYFFEVWLKDSADYMQSSKGFGTMTDSIGRLKCSGPILLRYDVKMYGDFTVYIPFAAMQVPSGIQRIKPVIKIVDQTGHIIKPGFGGEYFSMEVPPKLRIRVSVKEILAAEKDQKGENWDYQLNHPESGKPEVCWSINYSGQLLSRSPYEINSYTYSDPDGRYDFEFTISKNDLFYIEVEDFDVTSYSDKIGTLKVDMNEMQMLSGANINVKFDKVEKMDFTLTIL